MDEVMSDSAYASLLGAGFERVPAFEHMLGYRAFTGQDGTVELVRSYERHWNVWVILHANSEGEGRRVYTLANDVPFATARGLAVWYVQEDSRIRSELLRAARLQEIARKPGKSVSIFATVEG